MVDYTRTCIRNKVNISQSVTCVIKIFQTEFNISSYCPRKDQSIFSRHIEAAKSNGNVTVCCYDLNAVLRTPCGNISRLYYKWHLSYYR
ncbi:hypothetical protein PR048_001038 [Dryococelus australis]|uniref:Uncharacterized protein n=1 Tax=Dryococelus australis TaxID=614101 RepID=A0ABQ9IGV7_9NEOP|nr:hypothetical protein PR048_001038 [Dryococelus australis]